jgi:hypothetical protein
MLALFSINDDQPTLPDSGPKRKWTTFYLTQSDVYTIEGIAGWSTESSGFHPNRAEKVSKS